MVCDWCAQAADFASGRDGTPIEEGEGLRYAYELAAKMHTRCPGSPGCTCQHRPIEIRPNLPYTPTPESRVRAAEMMRR